MPLFARKQQLDIAAPGEELPRKSHRPKIRKPKKPPELHTSTLLQSLIDDAPEDFFTLHWLIDSIPHRSFGVVMLFLGLFAMIPVIGIMARILILILALQVIAGHRHPALPRKLLHKPFASHYLTWVERHAIPILRHVEKSIRPRWAFILHSRRISGLLALVLTIISLLAPFPFSNVPPSAVIVIMALAYIEHDGLLLLVGHIAGFSLLALTIIAIISAAG